MPSENLILNLVQNYGHQITTKSTIPDFLDELKSQKYDLLILDVMAPAPTDLVKLGFTANQNKRVRLLRKPMLAKSISEEINELLNE